MAASSPPARLLTRCAWPDEYGFGANREILLPVNVPVDALLPWLQKEDGSPYDYLGVFRFALPLLRGSKDRWFCSELVAAALRDLTGWQVDPAKARPSTVFFHLGGNR